MWNKSRVASVGVIACGLWAVYSTGCGRRPEAVQPGTAGSNAASGADIERASVKYLQACKATYGTPTLPPPSANVGTGECSTTHCGTNGIWLGEGVEFRELYEQFGQENSAGLAIVGFHDASQRPLVLQVRGDTLIGILDDKTSLTTDAQLRDAVIELAYARTPGSVAYHLKIDSVQPTRFWTTCAGCEEQTFSRYHFSARRADGDQCPLQVCAPGLDKDDPDGFQGAAVIFRGDSYGDHHTVASSTDTSAAFNIACMGTAIAKLELFRHTEPSSARKPPTRTMPALEPLTRPLERQSMLRLLTADYCGDGGAFTTDDLPLRIGINNKSFDLTASSSYIIKQPLDPHQIDAFWGADGATCIEKPRLSTETIESINKACKNSTNHPPIPYCSSTGSGYPFPAQGTDYGISMPP
ncbi:MAG: ADYC domain-containing protein [Kofleriaceae bacterium]